MCGHIFPRRVIFHEPFLFVERRSAARGIGNCYPDAATRPVRHDTSIAGRKGGQRKKGGAARGAKGDNCDGHDPVSGSHARPTRERMQQEDRKRNSGFSRRREEERASASERASERDKERERAREKEKKREKERKEREKECVRAGIQWPAREGRRWKSRSVRCPSSHLTRYFPARSTRENLRMVAIWFTNFRLSILFIRARVLYAKYYIIVE